MGKWTAVVISLWLNTNKSIVEIFNKENVHLFNARINFLSLNSIFVNLCCGWLWEFFDLWRQNLKIVIYDIPFVQVPFM